MGYAAAGGTAHAPVLPSWLRRVAHALLPYALGGTVLLFSFVSPLRPAVFLFDESVRDVRWPLVAVLALATAVSAALARWRLWPLFVTAPLSWLVAAMPAGMFTLSYYAAAGRPGHPPAPGRTWPYLLVALPLVGLPVGYSAAASPGIGGNLTSGIVTGLGHVTMSVVLPFVFGLWVRARRQVLAQLRERAERLEREQHERAERARAEERRRIAREMHDVVAHRVALMVLHAGALEVSTGDPRTAEEAALIRTSGREALQELRQVLGMLRAPDAVPAVPGAPELAPQPTLADLDRLLEASRSAGLPVRRADLGDPHPISLTAERTAYRVVQEGLTNVAKHAGPVPTTVTLHRLPRELTVTVENAAPARPVDSPPHSGLGLVGLTERVVLAGGSVDARPRLDGGFRLTARIPADAGGREQA